MSEKELEEDCPRLIGSGYRITSPIDAAYNCVAYAFGDTRNFWYDVQIAGYYWPPGVPSADTWEGWVKAFQIHGYVETADSSFENGFEKVAIYGSQECPEHVARQKANGSWASKMGKGHDIEHQRLSDLEGEMFGTVRKIMKRPCKDGKRVLE